MLSAVGLRSLPFASIAVAGTMGDTAGGVTLAPDRAADGDACRADVVAGAGVCSIGATEGECVAEAERSATDPL